MRWTSESEKYIIRTDPQNKYVQVEERDNIVRATTRAPEPLARPVQERLSSVDGGNSSNCDYYFCYCFVILQRAVIDLVGFLDDGLQRVLVLSAAGSLAHVSAHRITIVSIGISGVLYWRIPHP